MRRTTDHLAQIQPRLSRREFLEDLAVIAVIAAAFLLPILADLLYGRLHP